MIRGRLYVRCRELESSEIFRFCDSSSSDTDSPEDEEMTVDDEARLAFNVFRLGSGSGARLNRKGLTASTTVSCPCATVGGVGTVLTLALLASIRVFSTATFSVGAVDETGG